MTEVVGSEGRQLGWLRSSHRRPNSNLVGFRGPERTQFATRKHPSLDAPEQGLVEGLERRGAL